eukprot:9734892-Alexandrium_andersonii.AAC.1
MFGREMRADWRIYMLAEEDDVREEVAWAQSRPKSRYKLNAEAVEGDDASTLLAITDMEFVHRQKYIKKFPSGK